MRAALAPILFRPKKYTALTVANAITDASRVVGTQGDGLLNDSSFGIWPAATNLCTNGSATTNLTGWTGYQGDISRGVDGGKFGSTYIRHTSTHGADSIAYYTGTIAGATAGRYYAGSVWVRGIGGSIGKRVRLYMRATPSSQDSAGSSWLTLTADWQQLRDYIVVTSNTETGMLLLVDDDTVGGPLGVGGIVDIGGMEWELAAVASPYIPTDGATASRSAALVQIPAATANQLLNSTQGAVAMRVYLPYSSANPPSVTQVYFEWAADANNRITGTFGGGGWSIDRLLAGAGLVKAIGGNFNAGEDHTIIWAWGPAGGSVSVDGAAMPAGSANTSYPVLTAAPIDLGSDHQFGATFEIAANIRWAAFWDNKGPLMSDAMCATIHGFGNNDMGLSAFPGNPSGFWSAANGFMEVA